MTFGNRLKTLRTSNEMTQAELAAKLKVSKATMSKYENDIVEPNMGTISEISKIFSVSTGYLLGAESKTFHSFEHNSSSNDNLRFALFGHGGEEISDELLEEIREFANFKLEQLKKHG